jgi:colanic acid/amylovoran biosynthesis glycosyltransferase
LKNVALILSSKPEYSETFIIELIKGLENSKRINLKVFYGWKLNKWFGLYMIFNLLKVFLFPLRIFKNVKYISDNNPELKFKESLKITLYDLPVITSFIKFDFIHFAFSNLAVNNTHLSNHFGAKTSLSLRGYDITFFPINHKDCYKYVWNNIDQIQYNSNDLLNWAHKWGASSSIPSSLISAAVNDDFILKNISKIEIVAKDTPIKILTVGRFHWKKGIDTALYAVAECIKTNINIRYTIIGNGPEIEKIKYLIYALNIQNYVEIIDAIPHSEVINYIDGADLIVVPSIQEGCSNFVLESQARGKYCVVSNAEGMNQVVLDGITGKLIPRGDFVALKGAIIDFSNFTVEKRNEIFKQSISRIDKEFSRSQQIDKWLNFFNS